MFENSKIKFSPEHIPHLENFELMKDKIQNALRNRFLELYQDKTTKAFFFLLTATGKPKFGKLQKF
jgi:hypothetical protein